MKVGMFEATIMSATTKLNVKDVVRNPIMVQFN